MAIAGWAFIGPGHWVYAFVVQYGLLIFGLLAGDACTDVARSRYRVARLEPVVYRLIGVGVLQKFFKVVGWDRIIRGMRGDDGSPGSRERRLRGTEQSETGHLLGAIGTVALSVTAVAAGQARGAAQIAVVGVAVHVYPILLQRLVRDRTVRSHDR